MSFKVLNGDCLDLLKDLPDNSIDSIVTDPPAGISFMGKDWDSNKGGRDNWIKWMQSVAEECRRVLKPGGFALVWAIPRTSHWTATAWENAGFELKDIISHCFGSGFPKNMDIGKQVDCIQGNVRKVIDRRDVGHDITNNAYKDANPDRKVMDITKGSSDWEGWGTALKPAREDWLLLRKPVEKGLSIAKNCLKWGVGGINIDGCRVPLAGETPPTGSAKRVFVKNEYSDAKVYGDNTETSPLGRFPSNFIHDGSDEVVALFPDSKGGAFPKTNINGSSMFETNGINKEARVNLNDSGSAARFFYCAKASTSERNAGLDGFVKKDNLDYEVDPDHPYRSGKRNDNNANQLYMGLTGKPPTKQANHHPTVKPISLMRYLCRLITPKGGIVLDPFMGSGSTGIGAVLEGFSFTGFELESEYVDIARARIAHFMGNPEILLDSVESDVPEDSETVPEKSAPSIQLTIFEVSGGK